MPKQQLKRWLPTPEKLKESKTVRLFAPFLTDPRLWHMNRGSLGRAIYVGVICAFFPLPGQMLLALIGALLVRANVPMSIALTWITNPLTSIPAFWAAYWVGARLLDEPILSFGTIKAILTEATRWLLGNGNNPFIDAQYFSMKAFGVGLTVSAVVTSVVLGIAFDLFWRWRISKDWHKRHGYQAHVPNFTHQRKARKAQAKLDAKNANKPQ